MSKGLVISVGGSPEPIVYRIKRFEGDRMLCLVSLQSVESLVQLRLQLEQQGGKWPLFVEPVVTPDHEDLIATYRALEKGIGAWRAQHALAPDDIEIDYTGGSKPMSAGLVLYASQYGISRLGYVGGERRTKEGLGIVETGTEREIVTGNPFDVGLSFRLERWRLYSVTARYRLVAEESSAFQAGLSNPTDGKLCGIFSKVYTALDRWDRFELPRTYISDFDRALHTLNSIQQVKEDEQLEKWHRDLSLLNDHFKRLKEEERMAGLAWVYDLIANAQRRADCEQKYEDAVARLYSCFERLAQLMLRNVTGESVGEFPIAKLPLALRAEYESRYAMRGRKECVQLALHATMRLLAELGVEQGTEYLREDSMWTGMNSLLRIRNNSILGHGHEPVKRPVYEKFLHELVSFWALDLSQCPLVPNLPLAI